MTTAMLISIDLLSTVTGGAAAPSSGQAELRALAKDYCPGVYAQFKGAKTITRAMGERCLDEAGYGSWKSSLDKYFPKQGR
jgi:hypothetical protein